MQPRLPALVLMLSVGACASAPPVAVDQQEEAGPSTAQYVTQAGHSPPFARVPYEPFTRAEAVAMQNRNGVCLANGWTITHRALVPTRTLVIMPDVCPGHGSESGNTGGSGRTRAAVKRLGLECMMRPVRSLMKAEKITCVVCCIRKLCNADGRSRGALPLCPL